MIVVDASVTASALIYADDRGRRARAILGRDAEWAVPQHWMVEVALAESREITLVTSDNRLARTATGYCHIELA